MTILIEKEYFLWQLQKNKFDRSSQKTTLIAFIYTLLKDSFKDILQELMEAELDATLGYFKPFVANPVVSFNFSIVS